MPLSNEDSLRLNVLLANAVAIKLDEGSMCVQGLLKDGGETRFKLSPNCSNERYARSVKELLSSNTLGSPGGYPVFLKRWTRMGQTSDDARLADLLLLAEPEACVAVTSASCLTDELAERVWWAMPDAENARRMLKHQAVVQGRMGKVLADFLVEFLPFEQEPRAIIDSVALVLQPGLVSEEVRREIWARGRKKGIFRLGFLKTLPDALPQQNPPRVPDPALQALADEGNLFARQLHRLYSSNGQAYLSVCEGILHKPSNQDTVVALLETLADFLRPVRVFESRYHFMHEIEKDIHTLLEGAEHHPGLQQFLHSCGHLRDELTALLTLAHADDHVLTPIFSRTDAVGSVMRKKILPVVEPVVACLKTLQAKDG